MCLTTASLRSIFVDYFFKVSFYSSVLFLTACGNKQSTSDIDWQPYVFKESSLFNSKCINPRKENPFSRIASRDKQGTILDENNWLRSMSHEYYLWYDEIEDKDPADYKDPLEYFKLLKTSQKTLSGTLKDQFHFSYPTEVWEQFSVTGVSASYGVIWSFISSEIPREIVVSYTLPNSSARSAKLIRGAKLLKVDEFDIVNFIKPSDLDLVNAALFPKKEGEIHHFTILDPGSKKKRIITMTSANVHLQPVNKVKIINTDTGKVGYLSFLDHIATAEKELIVAINQLKKENITDLVLDLRYNQGGFLDISSELAYMIAGDRLTVGQAFESIRFNDKYPDINPATNQPIVSTPFFSQTQGYSVPKGQALPTLDLSRVYIITGDDTCSASESIINGLRGIDIDVIQIGTSTCGKPYGFYPIENCSTTYFSINFVGHNAKGFGDFSDGLSPVDDQVPTQDKLPGCTVADDFSHQLGDPLERRLATALAYRKNEKCPTQPAGSQARSSSHLWQDTIRITTPKPDWLRNKILKSNP